MSISIDEIIKQLRLMDDEFMTAVFDNNIEDTQLVLRIITGIDDLEVTEVISQREVKNLKGRSVRLDVLAKDSDDKRYDIEVQRTDSGAIPERARYNSSLLDGSIVETGAKFKDLPETYVIFITENDVMEANLPIYHIERVVMETGKMFCDREHIIYVNGATEEDSDLGRLMHDFKQTNPDKMYFAGLAKSTRYFKEEGGRLKMCKLVEDYVKQELEEERDDLLAEGRTEGLISSIKLLLKKMTPDEIIELGFSKEEVAMAQK